MEAADAIRASDDCSEGTGLRREGREVMIDAAGAEGEVSRGHCGVVIWTLVLGIEPSAQYY